MSECEEYRALIWAHLDGALTPGDEARLQTHLERCPECRALLNSLTALDEHVAELGEEPPEGLKDGILFQIDRDKKKPKRRTFFGPGTILAAAAAVAILLLGSGKLRFGGNVTSYQLPAKASYETVGGTNAALDAPAASAEAAEQTQDEEQPVGTSEVSLQAPALQTARSTDDSANVDSGTAADVTTAEEATEAKAASGSGASESAAPSAAPADDVSGESEPLLGAVAPSDAAKVDTAKTAQSDETADASTSNDTVGAVPFAAERYLAQKPTLLVHGMDEQTLLADLPQDADTTISHDTQTGQTSLTVPYTVLKNFYNTYRAQYEMTLENDDETAETGTIVLETDSSPEPS